MSGKIFLSGGGNEQQTRFLDEEFVKNLLRKKILYIPIALERDHLGFELAYDWIIKCLTQHTSEFLDIRMILDLGKISQDELNSYEAVYIGGGNTYKLLYFFTITNFNSKLINFYKNGGIIYGGSAGAIILGKDISIVKEENNNPEKYIYEQGLDLLNNFSILCHFNPDNLYLIEKVKEFVKRKKTEIIALPEDSGLIFHHNKFSPVGKNNVYKFTLNGNIEYLI
jgi:dipeptidase E